MSKCPIQAENSQGKKKISLHLFFRNFNDKSNSNPFKLGISGIFSEQVEQKG